MIFAWTVREGKQETHTVFQEEKNKSGFVFQAKWMVTHSTKSVPTFVNHVKKSGAIINDREDKVTPSEK